MVFCLTPTILLGVVGLFSFFPPRRHPVPCIHTHKGVHARGLGSGLKGQGTALAQTRRGHIVSPPLLSTTCLLLPEALGESHSIVAALTSLLLKGFVNSHDALLNSRAVALDTC